MLEILSWLAIFIAIAGLGVVGAVLARGGSARDLTQRFFTPRADPRIEVIEHAAMDGKRRLVLIRRDDVEHLLLTGGPVDVVIETGIGPPPVRPSDHQPAPTATVVTRPVRGFGARSAETGGSPPSLGLTAASATVYRDQEHELSVPDFAEARVERG
ncbi:MAG: hypothetical protein ACKVP4_06525 [Hyphomicrobium sp.]